MNACGAPIARTMTVKLVVPLGKVTNRTCCVPGGAVPVILVMWQSSPCGYGPLNAVAVELLQRSTFNGDQSADPLHNG